MKKLKVLILSLLALSFISCATTLSVSVPRAADLDLNGAHSIAIEPIIVSNYVRSRNLTYTRRITNYLEQNLEKDLNEGGYYKVIGVKDRRTPADVYLDCTIVIFDVNDDTRTEKVKNPNYKKASGPTSSTNGRRPAEPEYIKETRYKRSVRFIFKYEFVDGYTERVIFSNEFEFNSTSSEVSDSSRLEDPYNMVRSDLKKILTAIEHQVQPYFVNRSMTLLEVKNNDDMKYADKLADKGYLEESYNQYMSIYESTGLFEAGYDAAIVLEAQGKFVEARKLMKSLYEKTSDSRAAKELESIENEINLQKRLVDQENKRK